MSAFCGSPPFVYSAAICTLGSLPTFAARYLNGSYWHRAAREGHAFRAFSNCAGPTPRLEADPTCPAGRSIIRS